MRAERTIKYELLELTLSQHYGEEKKGKKAVYFAGISTRNRFPNELFGLNLKKI